MAPMQCDANLSCQRFKDYEDERVLCCSHWPVAWYPKAAMCLDGLVWGNGDMERLLAVCNNNLMPPRPVPPHWTIQYSVFHPLASHRWRQQDVRHINRYKERKRRLIHTAII
ncbi:hypothetical protein GMDG_03386 [Pseudogymnoascus destructans 20631-21]|uniref:Uncharacterized protein n=1 Tax=Pseudogymnoascus destructans (strain ATCC MYA-4855 / 20631-21) TaxID=658429 RepID=L8G782_PSED2|nr:hypothetical protein GMDG_03386 [Pseudogymnoascus destructans 20631-21]